MLLSLSIVVIIMALIFTIFLFGVKIYDKGNIQSNIQEDLRFTSDFITKELRISNMVYNDLSDIPDDIEEYYILEFKNNHIYNYKVDPNTGKKLNKELGYQLSHVSFSLDKSGIFSYTIKAKIKEQNQSISNKVLINNLINNSNNKDFEEVTIIYYIK